MAGLDPAIPIKNGMAYWYGLPKNSGMPGTRPGMTQGRQKVRHG
jgi:hypothetical protein